MYETNEVPKIDDVIKSAVVKEIMAKSEIEDEEEDEFGDLDPEQFESVVEDDDED